MRFTYFNFQTLHLIFFVLLNAINGIQSIDVCKSSESREWSSTSRDHLGREERLIQSIRDQLKEKFKDLEKNIENLEQEFEEIKQATYADIDECLSNKTNNCHAQATCHNAIGSYRCRCNPGWTGNGKVCHDIDECLRNETNDCHVQATCHNTIGSYTCTCNPGWLGSGKNCSDATCRPALNNIPDGRVEGGQRIGDVAIYSCDEGFLLRGNKRRRCRGDRKWSGDEPVCHAVVCTAPKPPSNGLVDTMDMKVFPYNIEVRCHCEIGFFLEGNRSRRCVEDSTQESAPICVGFYTGSRIMTKKCIVSGTWDVSCGTCKRVECVDPKSAINDQDGDILDYRPSSHYVGDQLRFECRSGYNQIGSKNRTCLPSGRWSGVDTVCDRIRTRKEKSRCPNPGVPIGGQTIPRRINYTKFKENETVRFQCNHSLIMVGEPVQRCSLGEWSGGGSPQCLDHRYRDIEPSVIEKLLESRNANQASLPPVGPFIESEANHEIYFLFDLSESVSSTALNNSLTFAVKLIQRLSANSSGVIKYGVMVFASEVVSIVDILEEQPAADEVIDKIINIGIDRQSIQAGIKSRRNTEKVLRSLFYTQMTFSYALDCCTKERHVFIFTDGSHNEGASPQVWVEILRTHENPPTFYVVTSCIECHSEVTGDETYDELLSLAGGQLENYILLSNFYEISELLDTVTDARIDHGKCGHSRSVKNVQQQDWISNGIGGAQAPTRSWPWQVVISLKDVVVIRSYATNTFRGGGTLINNRWVLTAAHLFQAIGRQPDWERQFLLTFGIHNLPTSRGDLLSAKVKVFAASKIIEHPNYEVASVFDLDVAMIKIGQEYEQHQFQFRLTPNFGFVNYTEYIRPVCLPCVPGNCLEQYLFNERKLFGNETLEQQCAIETEFLLREDAEDRILAVATGFGDTEERRSNDLSAPERSRKLRQKLLRIRNNEYCSDFASMHIPWQFLAIPFTESMLCATSGVVGHIIDTCQGDNGGPLVREISYATEGKNKTCWVQVGIVSWGWGCGQSLRINGKLQQVPGYYTNIMAVSSWIKDTMAMEEY